MRVLTVSILLSAGLLSSAAASAHCNCAPKAAPVTNGGQASVITQERGVKVIRPRSVIDYDRARVIYAQDKADKRARRAMALQRENAARQAEQDLRLARLEDNQRDLEDDVDDLYRPQRNNLYNYPTYQGRRVFIAGDPRFAGPNGFNTRPRRVPIRLDGIGVVPAPRRFVRGGRKR